MEGTYPVYHGSRIIGQAEVTRCALYYQFSCRLRLSGEVIFRLEIRCGDVVENLGILVPENDGFVLRKTLPVSRFGSDKPEFRILPRRAPMKETFIALRPEEPFAYLARLENARLQSRDGRPVIVLPEQGEY